MTGIYVETTLDETPKLGAENGVGLEDGVVRPVGETQQDLRISLEGDVTTDHGV